MTILDEIFADKRLEVARRKRETPLPALREAADARPQAIDFSAALRSARRAPALIAEVKAASPSRGVLLPDFDPVSLARIYAQNGASAISVLTDEKYFKGSLDYLRQIAYLGLNLPLLRKDFICDPYQIYEARAAGADALLLIAAHLPSALLADLLALTAELGMSALVEVHTRSELESVIPLAPRLIGINNRDLHDFTVRLETTLALIPLAPPDACLVAESGIHTPQDVARLAGAGVHAILVGEALVTAPDIAAQVRALAGVEEQERER